MDLLKKIKLFKIEFYYNYTTPVLIHSFLYHEKQEIDEFRKKLKLNLYKFEMITEEFKHIKSEKKLWDAYLNKENLRIYYTNEKYIFCFSFDFISTDIDIAIKIINAYRS